MALTTGTESALLDAYPALAELAPELLAELRSGAQAASFRAGDTVFEPADFCVVYPLLLAGNARVLKVGVSAPDTLLYRLGPGEHCLLSSSGLLARWRFGARVVAETGLSAVVLPAPLFRRLVRGSEIFATAIHVAIARRLEVVMDLVEQATYFRLDRRVASLLLARGAHLAMTHQELADDLGASRENVSRVLETFRGKGWVELGRKRIEVLDPSALETFLDQDG